MHFNKLRTILKMVFLWILIPEFAIPENLFSQDTGDPGYYPPYVDYMITVEISGFVHIVEGLPETGYDQAPPQSGVKLKVWVEYDEYDDNTGNPIHIEKYETVYSVSSGMYYKSFDLMKVFKGSIRVQVEFTRENRNKNLLLKKIKYSNLSDTYHVVNFYAVNLNDSDHNGIRDEFEMELAKKFCPSLKLNTYGSFVKPEMVQIMGGPHNSDIYVTLTDSKDEDKERPTVPANAIRYKKRGVATQWTQIIADDQFGKRWNYSNEFKTNPIILGTGDSLQWPLKRNDPFGQSEKSELDRRKFLWIHFDWIGGNVNEWWTEYDNKVTELIGYREKYPNTIYCTLWEEMRNYSYSIIDNYVIALQYWFFYPFNDFGNDHEGDWEHINVIVFSQFPEISHINEVQFYFHEKWKEWKPEKLEIEDGTHVRVYVGGTFLADNFTTKDGHISGASYPAPGRWKDIASVFDEQVHGNGPYIPWHAITNDSDGDMDGKGIEILKDPGQLDFSYFDLNGGHPELSWIKANIFFGEPHSRPWLRILPVPAEEYDLASIKGPAQKSAWRILGTSPGFEYYH